MDSEEEGIDSIYLQDKFNNQSVPGTSNAIADNTTTPAAKAKKRHRKEETWKRHVLKKQRASSRPDVSPSSVVMEGRITGPDCKFKAKCFTKVPDDIKRKIVENFNSAEVKNKQDI